MSEDALLVSALEAKFFDGPKPTPPAKTQEVIDARRHEAVRQLYLAAQSVDPRAVQMARAQFAQSQRAETVSGAESVMKIGRNDPCPCGSGQKFKMCCLDGGR